jgi:hypothetical protein
MGHRVVAVAPRPYLPMAVVAAVEIPIVSPWNLKENYFILFLNSINLPLSIVFCPFLRFFGTFKFMITQSEGIHIKEVLSNPLFGHIQTQGMAFTIIVNSYNSFLHLLFSLVGTFSRPCSWPRTVTNL